MYVYMYICVYICMYVYVTKTTKKRGHEFEREWKGIGQVEREGREGGHGVIIL